MSATDRLSAAAAHPRVASLGRDADEQARVGELAVDLARFLCGAAPPERLRPLGRVVARVARKELRDPRRLCDGQPLMAVEAAARATEALWPLLRGAWTPPPPEPPAAAQDPQPEAGEGAPAAGEEGEPQGSGGDGQGEGEASPEPPQGEGEAEATPDGPEGQVGPQEAPAPSLDDLLRALAGDDAADLDALAQRVADAFSAGEAPDALDRAGEAATDGALDTARAARHLERFLPGIGWSAAPQALEAALLERLDQLARLLERVGDLDRIAEQLGRIEGEAARDGHERGGGEEVTGVRLGGEVAHALPAELALLADPDTEDLFYQRLVEQRLLSLELTGAGLGGAAQGERRGPVIACVDTSGSMEGPPELAAKALILALCRRILPQGRAVHLLMFGGTTQLVELRLRRGLGGLEGLLAFLARTFRAGTDFDVPLQRGLALLDEDDLRAADLLVVTDGLCRATPPVIAAVDRARQGRGARVFSVLLGAGDEAGVRPFSDAVWRIDAGQLAKARGLWRALEGR